MTTRKRLSLIFGGLLVIVAGVAVAVCFFAYPRPADVDTSMIRGYLKMARNGRALDEGDADAIAKHCAARTIPECDEIKRYLPQTTTDGSRR